MKTKVIKSVYEWFLRNGEDVYPAMGTASNAYCVARDTGVIPTWCVPGSACYSAARAGITRRQARISKVVSLDFTQWGDIYVS